MMFHFNLAHPLYYIIIVTMYIIMTEDSNLIFNKGVTLQSSRLRFFLNWKVRLMRFIVLG